MDELAFHGGDDESVNDTDNDTDDDVDDWHHMVRSKLESDDSWLERLIIDNKGSEYQPIDGDWERDGLAVGRNTQLQALGIYTSPNTNVDMVKFFSGAASNKSITNLTFRGCHLFGGFVFSTLLPMFNNNPNLQHMSVVSCMEKKSISMLAFALERFNTLKRFEYSLNGEGEKGEENIIKALAGHSNLSTLILSSNEIGPKGVEAMAALVKKKESKLQNISLKGSLLDDARLCSLVDALAENENTSLTALDLGQNPRITAMSWKYLFSILHYTKIETLSLEANSIDDTAFKILSKEVKNNQLKSLNLDSSRHITDSGWRSLFSALESAECVLEILHLCNNDLRDQNVIALTSSLMNNSTLKDLRLACNEGVGTRGWTNFASALKQPNSAITNLDIGCCRLNDAVAISLADSLGSNSKLTTLDMRDMTGTPHISHDITLAGWKAFRSALCDKSSVIGTYDQSNHTLKKVFPSYLSPEIDFNRDASGPFEAARRKIIDVHFSRKTDFNLQPFFDMKTKAVPWAIAWMAKDRYGFRLLYQYVRHQALLFDGVENKATEPAKKKQKVDQ